MEHIKRILVVDDEPHAVKSLLRHLWREGFDTDSALDGMEARQKVHKASMEGAPFDLLILDVVMPRMDGIQLFRWVKENYPHMSAIFMSAFGDTDAIVESIRPGIDDFVRKPFTPGELMELIGSVELMRGLVGHPKSEGPSDPASRVP